jgi:hypothetical protein
LKILENKVKPVIMGTGIPLLNEYKREFLSKRFPQTLLGGPKLRLGCTTNANVKIKLPNIILPT